MDRPKSIGQAHRIILQQQAEIERLRHALRMIAGEVPCLDMNMGNVDIAVAALRGEGGE